MGMFDCIEYEGPCPNCGTVLKDGWQSKDGNCELALLKPEKVRGFYNICSKCETWIQMKVVAKVVEVSVDYFRKKGELPYNG